MGIICRTTKQTLTIEILKVTEVKINRELAALAETNVSDSYLEKFATKSIISCEEIIKKEE